MTDLNFPLSMALQNYMPVLLSALGVFWIAQLIRRESPARGQMAWVGLVLILVAGVLKATWKLSMSLSHADVALFRDSLFPIVGPGFTLMTFALMKKRDDKPIWRMPTVICGVALGLAGALAISLQSRVWVYLMMGLTTVANTAFMILLMRRAWAQHQAVAFALFAVNLIVGFVLAGIGALPNKTLESHWIEQLVSTVSNAGFACAAWLLAYGHVNVTRAQTKLNSISLE